MIDGKYRRVPVRCQLSVFSSNAGQSVVQSTSESWRWLASSWCYPCLHVGGEVTSPLTAAGLETGKLPAAQQHQRWGVGSGPRPKALKGVGSASLTRGVHKIMYSKSGLTTTLQSSIGIIEKFPGNINKKICSSSYGSCLDQLQLMGHAWVKGRKAETAGSPRIETPRQIPYTNHLSTLLLCELCPVTMCDL